MVYIIANFKRKPPNNIIQQPTHALVLGRRSLIFDLSSTFGLSSTDETESRRDGETNGVRLEWQTNGVRLD